MTAIPTLIDKLGWRKLDKQRLINKAAKVHKSLNGLAPNYLRSKFTYRSNVSSYSLIDTNNNLTIPLPRKIVFLSPDELTVFK